MTQTFFADFSWVLILILHHRSIIIEFLDFPTYLLISEHALHSKLLTRLFALHVFITFEIVHLLYQFWFDSEYWHNSYLFFTIEKYFSNNI